MNTQEKSARWAEKALDVHLKMPDTPLETCIFYGFALKKKTVDVTTGKESQCYALISQESLYYSFPLIYDYFE